MVYTGLLVSAILKGGSDIDKMYRLLVVDELGVNHGMILENKEIIHKKHKERQEMLFYETFYRSFFEKSWCIMYIKFHEINLWNKIILKQFSNQHGSFLLQPSRLLQGLLR